LITDGGSCATSPNHPNDYGNNEDCTIYGLPPVGLEVLAFDVYDCPYDYLTVNGVKYCGDSGPAGVEALDGTLQWHSDDVIVDPGWKVCWPAQSPSPPPAGTVTGDPHLLGAHGDHFSFRGANNTIYSLLSARNLAVNGLFSPVSFVMGGTCALCGHKTVHGSFIKVVYISARTPMKKTLHLEYRADEPSTAQLKVIDADVADSGLAEMLATERNLLVSTKKPDAVEDATDGVRVRLERVHTREVELTLTTGEWVVKAASRYLAFASQNAFKKRLDVVLEPLKDTLEQVAPHGLIGQTFDGDAIAIDGAVDDYSPDVVVTLAMGEGAIEGDASDYEIKRSEPFSTAFKFSRYDAVHAVPRDVSKLTGLHREVRTAGSSPTETAGASGDDLTRIDALSLVPVE